jgi:hypothetical protein
VWIDVRGLVGFNQGVSFSRGAGDFPGISRRIFRESVAGFFRESVAGFSWESVAGFSRELVAGFLRNPGAGRNVVWS